MSSPSSLQVPRRLLLLLVWIFIAAVPVAYVAVKAVDYSRNIVFWDEFDSALDLILRLDAGAGTSEVLHRLFAITNEHRTVTSRLIFALSYWLTGTVNFHVIGAIGNLFLVGACAILLRATHGWERQVRLGVVLAFLLFQLEHFESFFWSGSSIDHFQVVMLAVGALAALQRGSNPGVGVGALLGLLATFTLAHGALVWPIGAALLGHQRRWRQFAAWLGCGGLAAAFFLYGFQFNPGHKISELTLHSFGHVIGYWLVLLGAPLTLGDAGFAPVPGVVLLVILGVLVARGALTREPLALFSALFAVGSLALVAVGRAELAATDVNSRYLVLGALAWALAIFTLLELADRPGKPFLLLTWMLPALAVFTFSANRKYAPLAEGYLEARERAATMFLQHGQDGRGLLRLHPNEGHAERILQLAAERGVYQLPPLSREVEFAELRDNPRIIAHLDEFTVNDRSILIGGWAMLPGVVSERDQIHVLLQSRDHRRIFSTVTLLRPDVAKAYRQPHWQRAGFRAVIPRALLPAEDFSVGVILAHDHHPDVVMTRNRLELTPGKNAVAVRSK